MAAHERMQPDHVLVEHGVAARRRPRPPPATAPALALPRSGWRHGPDDSPLAAVDEIEYVETEAAGPRTRVGRSHVKMDQVHGRLSAGDVGRLCHRDPRFDTTIEDGKVTSYRVRLNVQVRSERLAGLPPPSRPRVGDV